MMLLQLVGPNTVLPPWALGPDGLWLTSLLLVLSLGAYAVIWAPEAVRWCRRALWRWAAALGLAVGLALVGLLLPDIFIQCGWLICCVGIMCIWG